MLQKSMVGLAIPEEDSNSLNSLYISDAVKYPIVRGVGCRNERRVGENQLVGFRGSLLS